MTTASNRNQTKTDPLVQRLKLSSAWAEDELQEIQQRGHLRMLEALSSPQGAVVQVDGETLLNFSSNDYLGLASDERLGEAVHQGLGVHGTGAGASRLLAGDSRAHGSLEARLAQFERTESAVLFNSGYAANVGVITSLCTKGDVIFSDALNHASIVDGCRLSRATVVVYPHSDLAALEHLVKSVSGRRRLLCTGSVFSMDGDRAPLVPLLELCKRHDVAVMVDEAHATGVMGDYGGGLCDELGISNDIDVRIGTLSKALGLVGGFAATSASVASLLVNRARTFIYSTALPPALCFAAERALDLVEYDDVLRVKLWRNIQQFAEGLRRLGIPAEPRSPIFPVVVGDATRALELSAALRAKGILAKAIRPPTVAEGTSRVRFSLSAAHTEEHLDRALSALAEGRGFTNHRPFE